MTEPERIWAVPERNCTVYMSGNSPITAQDGPFTHPRHGAASEYIRADLVAALKAENQRLRGVLETIATTGRCEFAVVRAALRSTEASHDD